MKKITFLFTFLIVLNYISFGQNSCNSPMASYQFQNLKSQMQSQSAMSARLSVAMNAIQGNCFTATQVKELLLMFAQDQEKLTFAKAVYPKTLDKNNFYDVYDAFAYFSSVFRLHDHIQAKTGTVVTPPTGGGGVVVVTEPELKFALLLYPNPNGYAGKTNCSSFLANSDFMFLARQVHKAVGESAKFAKATQIVRTNCLSVAQIMKIASLLELENDRLSLLKIAYERTYDVEHYSEAHQLFQHYPNQQALNEFIKSKNITVVVVGGTVNNCQITASEMGQIKNSIKNESFSSGKKMLAKQILQSKKCFTAVQVSQIVNIFSFDADKLEIAKFAYDYTTDPDNYHILNSSFSFSSSKEDLMKYVNSKR